MYSPHNVALVVISEGTGGTTEQQVTYLDGVFLDEDRGLETNKSRLDINKVGLWPKDFITLYVPLEQVKATGAENGKPRKYIPVYEYNQKEDKSGFWTVFISGRMSTQDCFFVKGKISPGNLLDYSTLRKNGYPCFRVTSIMVRDYGITIKPYLQIGADE